MWSPQRVCSFTTPDGATSGLERFDAGALDAGTRPAPWQWYSPVFRFVWHPEASRPPGCAAAGRAHGQEAGESRQEEPGGESGESAHGILPGEPEWDRARKTLGRKLGSYALGLAPCQWV